MEKNLIVVGNSLALVIDQPTRRMLNLVRSRKVRVSTDGRRLIVEPVRSFDPVANMAPPVFDRAGPLSLAEQQDAVTVFRALQDRYGITARELAALHHAPKLPIESTGTLFHHTAWLARGGQRTANAEETGTVRRMRYCLECVLAGAAFERAVELACLAFPKSELAERAGSAALAAGDDEHEQRDGHRQLGGELGGNRHAGELEAHR